MSPRWMQDITILLLIIIIYDSSTHQTCWEKPTTLSVTKATEKILLLQSLAAPW